MILLTDPTHSLELVSTSTSNLDVTVGWVDITAAAATPDSNRAKVTTATTTTIAAAPAASTTRQVKRVTVRNTGTGTQVVTVQTDESGTKYTEEAAALLPGEALHYQDGSGWAVIDTAGRVKVMANETEGIDGREIAFYKVGTAPEAAGVWYSWAKDPGTPGAWAPGTPGLAGRATDGTAAGDAGCLPISNPASGANYLASFQGAPSVACHPWLFDVLLVNSGIVVTTTTAQTLNTVALPARDRTGTTNGGGVWAGLLVTTATTNAGAVTNTTISYTNQDGTAGRTATMASFPATAVIGTVVWFQLQAGDYGVRSVQSITLGTSYAAGAVSLVLARPLLSFPGLTANVGGQNLPPYNPGVRLYNGACVLPFGLMSGTGAVTIAGSGVVLAR